MSEQHRATPEQWDIVENLVSITSHDSCVVELRDRLAAVEKQLADKPPTPCPHIRSSDEGTNYCDLALQTAGIGNSAEPANTSAPAESLVEVVGKAICTVADCDDTPLNWAPEARAAILAVAGWLDAQNVGAGRAAARWLREEMER